MKPTPLEMWDLTARGKRAEKQLADLKTRQAIRQAALSKPITAEQVTYHAQFLEAVPHAGGICHVYTSKSTGGRTNVYGRMKHNGIMVQAHRFALALKLGCTLWDLEGANAGHAPISVCTGGRCCNHVHLKKEDSMAYGAWQRSADRGKAGTKPERTPAQQRRMVGYMYPKGLPAGQRLLVGRTLVVGQGAASFTITVD